MRRGRWVRARLPEGAADETEVTALRAVFEASPADGDIIHILFDAVRECSCTKVLFVARLARLLPGELCSSRHADFVAWVGDGGGGVRRNGLRRSGVD